MSILPAAVISNASGFTGAYLGLTSPFLDSGKLKFPQHLSNSTGSMTSTGARYYTIPFYIDKIETFSGVKFNNSGAGDSGDKVKVAIYPASSSGGLGTLEKNFGEVTLTAAAAMRTLASSWTPSQTGWFWFRMTSDNPVAFYAMDASYSISNAGIVPRDTPNGLFGIFSSDLSAGNYAALGYGCDYVDGTYANFPESTPLASTASLVGGQAIPSLALYK